MWFIYELSDNAGSISSDCPNHRWAVDEFPASSIPTVSSCCEYCKIDEKINETTTSSN